MIGKMTTWLWAALLAVFGIWFLGGCDLPSLLVPECPVCDCSQCEVTLGGCLDAGVGLLDGDD